MSPYIQSIYSSGRVIGKSGQEHALSDSIDPEEGAFLHRLIAGDAGVTRTLEVGCANGLSALHVCEATRARPGARHTIVDPFQNTQWDGAGVRNLENAGIDFFRLIEKKSEFALPELLAEGEGTFDFIFVDGWHTFDHTLLDCFYATRLLRVGGYLAVDDVAMPAVRKCVDHLLSYPCYEQVAMVPGLARYSRKRRLAGMMLRPVPEGWRRGLFQSDFLRDAFGEVQIGMIALRKIAPDERTWDWYENF